MLNLIFAILIICCVIDFWKSHKFFTPIFMFNFVWLITLSLYEMKLSYLQSELSDRTITVFFAAIVSFNAAYFIIHLVNSLFKKKKAKIQDVDDNQSKEVLSEKRIKIANYIILIVFVIEAIYSGGLPLIWRIFGSSKIYVDYGIPSLHGAFNGLIICMGAYSIYSKKKISFLYLLISILILSRQVIISMFIEAIICIVLDLNKKIKKRNKKQIIIYSMLILVTFTFLGNFRSGDNTMDRVFYPKEEYKNLSDTTKWVYSYMTFSINNFNRLTSMTKGNINKGATMLDDLLPTILLEKVNIRQAYKPFYLVSLNYTVSTYMPPIYLDFGINGIIVFSIFMAFVGWFYFKKYNDDKESIKNKLLYSLFLHNIILLFFNNMFLYLPVVIQLVYIPLIFKNKKEIKV